MKTNILIYLLTLVCFFAQAQTQTISMQANAWKIKAKKHQFITYKGKESLYLENGKAWAKDHQFINGIIEFDIAIPQNRQFSGVYFRTQDHGKNGEHFYLRAHQSGNPDANQYTPVFNEVSGWQLYYGTGHAKPFKYRFNEWMHVKVVIADKQAEFYIDDMKTPLFRASELKNKVQTGLLGFNSNLGGAHFANLKYKKNNTPEFKFPALVKKPLPKGTITQWQVSNVFKETRLKQQYILGSALKSELQWTNLKTEFTGTANLAKVSLRNRKKKLNTVFARVVIQSDKVQIKEMNFGYSDRVRVYCNGQLMYSGNNGFLSRDYRYLGTIGYFDTVYLPLKKGKNEIWLAVSENFGGWGVKAKLNNTTGIKMP